MRMAADSYLIKQERCPKCYARGKDNSSDNLAVYSDGHSYCFSCGYHIGANKVEAFKRALEPLKPIKDTDVYLPEDVSTEYPYKALQWVSQYELTKTDLLNHGVLWSDSLSRLIFPIYSTDGVVAWQGRYFGEEEKAKWFGKGPLSMVYNILGKDASKLILVEDILSGIRCADYYHAMPLYGSHISLKRWEHLKLLGYTRVCIFLDPDKRKEALVFGKEGSLFGITTHIILANKDPKEINRDELKELLDSS